MASVCLDSSLLIYLVTLILILIIFYKLGCTIWSSLLFAFVISLAILVVIYPPSKLNPWTANCESNSSIYLVILILTPIYITIYALVLAWNAKRRCCTFK
jgi:archaellum biogenesis protein FlaJ (TadC family)